MPKVILASSLPMLEAAVSKSCLAVASFVK
jgi:hypothetical protein